MKLGHKAARGLGLGGSAAAIYSHSQERRDLLVLGHAADFRWARGAFNSVERLRVNKDFKELESAIAPPTIMVRSRSLPAAVIRARRRAD